jgi:hypothetical protein
METGLRELIARQPTEEFRGVYLTGGLNPTRSSILAPGAIGVYLGGGTYNPAQVMRDLSAKASTEKIDQMLMEVRDGDFVEVTAEEIRDLIALTVPDQTESERVWNSTAIGESVLQFVKLHEQATGFIYVDRNRGLKERRRETQGILAGGEAARVPGTKVTLFLLRTTADRGKSPAWWPQVRFPAGRYAFAFAL